MRGVESVELTEKHAVQRGDVVRKSDWLFWVLASFLILSKISLTSGNEIIAGAYDAEAYVLRAKNAVWAISAMPMGYPVWLDFSRHFGLPQRLALELLLVFSAVLLAALMRRSFGRVAALTFLVLVLVSPATYFLFDNALSDGFYACLTLLAVSLSFLSIFSLKKRAVLGSSFALGVIIGLMALTRSEDPLYFLWGLGVLGARYFWTRRPMSGWTRLGWREQALIAVLIAGPACLLVGLGSAVHSWTSGVFARNIPSIPAHTRFLKNLSEIDAGGESIRYVPVSAAARALAYKVSPTLQPIAVLVEDQQNIYQKASRAAGIPAGEIGAGWIWHVFNGIIFNNVAAGDVRRLPVIYDQINEELASAFQDGLLKRKFVWHQFLTAPLADVLSRSPAAMWVVASKTFRAPVYVKDSDYQKEIFDDVALRRSSLTGAGVEHVVQGWVFADSQDKKVVALSISGAEDAQVKYFDRPDVVEGQRVQKGWSPAVMGYLVKFQQSENSRFSLRYLLSDGSHVTGGSDIVDGRVSVLSSSSGVNVVQGIDYAKHAALDRRGWRHKFQLISVDWANSPGVATAFIFLIVAFTAFHAWRVLRRAGGIDAMDIFFWFLLAMFSLRIVFYGLMESEAWVIDVRYMLAANFMGGILVALGVARLGTSRRWLRR
jgi:hypothetical protein